MLIVGTPNVWQRDLLMSLAWAINLLIAELTIRWLRGNGHRGFSHGQAPSSLHGNAI